MNCSVDKKIYMLAAMAIVMLTSSAQIAVQMKMPEQSTEQLNVDPLFDVPVSPEASILLSNLDFDITGGYPPYTLVWLEDNQVITNWSGISIQAGTNIRYALKVSDQRNCYVITEINFNTTSGSYFNNEIEADIFPTLVRDHFNVIYPLGIPDATVTILDLQGVVMKKLVVPSLAVIPINFPKGMYLVMLKGTNFILTKKIIIL